MLSRDFLKEQRKHERKALTLSVTLFFENEATKCKVLDISVGGAKVLCSKPFEKGADVILRFENFGDFKSHVVWRNEEYHGLKFLDDPAHIAEALAALALYG